MKLLYCGAPFCDNATFKWLLTVADAIAFMDRPSVSFDNWGTVGYESPARAYVKAMSTTPVPVSVYRPPSGPAGALYQRYVDVDLADTEFRNVVLTGLRADERFANKLIQLEGQYRSGTGRDVVRALVGDSALREVGVADADVHQDMFGVAEHAARRGTLRVVLTQASIHVTSAMLVARYTGLIPVTDDPFLSHLIALRTEQPYVGGTASRAPLLGLAVAKAVIPDEALQRLKFSDIIEYRESSKDAYTAWSTELNRLAAKIDDIPPADLEKNVARLIASEIAPKLREYRDQMKSARDKLFGDLIKRVASWEVPTLSIAYLTNLSLGTALLAFANALLPAVPAVVDYLQNTSEVKRKNGLSYLIGLAQEEAD